jgi:hypothetical protein
MPVYVHDAQHLIVSKSAIEKLAAKNKTYFAYRATMATFCLLMLGISIKCPLLYILTVPFSLGCTWAAKKYFSPTTAETKLLEMQDEDEEGNILAKDTTLYIIKKIRYKEPNDTTPQVEKIKIFDETERQTYVNSKQHKSYSKNRFALQTLIPTYYYQNEAFNKLSSQLEECNANQNSQNIKEWLFGLFGCHSDKPVAQEKSKPTPPMLFNKF